MIPKDVLLKSLYFDIESAGYYSTYEDLRDHNPGLADLWDKRCKWLRLNSGAELADASEAQLWLEKASLHPEFARVVCVTIGAYKEGELNMISFTGTEDEILAKTNKVFDNAYSKSLRLAGHTIKNFDIPFLGKRMIINGIKPSELLNTFGKKPWEMSVMDITEVFSFGASGQSHTSLDLMCQVLGVQSPKTEMKGSDVHEVYWNGGIEKIKRYCESDVRALVECFNKFVFK
jgi:DNA polymerase elongation subunit (family B)